MRKIPYKEERLRKGKKYAFPPHSQKIGYMHEKHGEMPGHKCGNCVHFTVGGCVKFRLDHKRVSVRWLSGYPACLLFEQLGDKPIEAAVRRAAARSPETKERGLF